MRKNIIYHSLLLILCSCIGFIGHYLQFGFIRITPWIPATIGITLILIQSMKKEYKTLQTYLSFFIILLFGIILNRMNWSFLFQEWQPMRKKIIFSLMSISSFITLISFGKYLYKQNKK